MNHIVTSREEILKVSKNLIIEKGWNSVNIRSVASACNVSVGSIYNYFHSKSDLIGATIESVWCEIFHFPKDETIFHSFINCIQWIYARMEYGNHLYPGFFTLHSMSFLGKDKLKGQQLMRQSLEHIQMQLCYILTHDKNVRPDCFNDVFTPEKFVAFVLSFIVSSLMKQNYDSSTLLEVIQRTIYK